MSRVKLKITLSDLKGCNGKQKKNMRRMRQNEETNKPRLAYRSEEVGKTEDMHTRKTGATLDVAREFLI